MEQVKSTAVSQYGKDNVLLNKSPKSILSRPTMLGTPIVHIKQKMHKRNHWRLLPFSGVFLGSFGPILGNKASIQHLFIQTETQHRTLGKPETVFSTRCHLKTIDPSWSTTHQTWDCQQLSQRSKSTDDTTGSSTPSLKPSKQHALRFEIQPTGGSSILERRNRTPPTFHKCVSRATLNYLQSLFFFDPRPNISPLSGQLGADLLVICEFILLC